MAQVALDNLDDPLVFERVESFAGGEDSYRRPTLLAADESQKLVNVIVRDNYEARTRPGADKLGSDYVNKNVTTATFASGATSITVGSATGILAGDSVAGTGIPSGTTVTDISGAPILVISAATTAAGSGNYTFVSPIKGLFYFDTPTYQQLLAATNAKIRKYTSTTWSDAGWTPTAGNRVEMAQGVDKVLMTDGVQNMRSYDGAAFTDLGNGANSPPVGATILCWHTGRMFASGQPANPDTIWLSTRLDFGIGAWNSTVRSFRIGGGEGDPIMAMASMQGFVLAVLKESSIWLVTTDPQAEPADFQAEQSSLSLSYGVGCVGKHAWCANANDVIFMAQDGVRTIRRMAAATGQYELSAPISEPIQGYIDRINTNYRHLITAVNYLEFVLFSVPLDSSTYNNAVLVWNERLGKWLGVWEGWTPAEWCVTKFNGNIHLTFGDNAGYVNQFKDKNSQTDDATYLDNGVGYPSKDWTKSFVFGDFITDKRLYNAILRFTAGHANMTMTVVCDLAEGRVWSNTLEPSGDILGTGTLPFLLASSSPTTIKKGLRGIASFNECYLRIESTTGWWHLRNVTLGAFVNALSEIP